MFTVQFLLRCLSDLYALSLPGPPMCLPLDNVSSIFVEVCCSCRFRSLRPAYESAEKDHSVPGSSSVTSLWDADVGWRDMWARSRRSSPVESTVEGHCHRSSANEDYFLTLIKEKNAHFSGTECTVDSSSNIVMCSQGSPLSH